MSTIKTDTLQNVAGTKSVPVNTVVDGSAKAWVNFNGTGTVAIRAAFNVSSITDGGVGQYTVNFTVALPDANYGTALNATVSGTYLVVAQSSKATGALVIASANTSGGLTDASTYDVAIFR